MGGESGSETVVARAGGLARTRESPGDPPRPVPRSTSRRSTRSRNPPGSTGRSDHGPRPGALPRPRSLLRAEFLRRGAISGPSRRTRGRTRAIDEDQKLSACGPGGDRPAMGGSHQVLTRSGRFVEAGCVAGESGGGRVGWGSLHPAPEWAMLLARGHRRRRARARIHDDGPAQSLWAAADDPSGDIFLSVVSTSVLLILGAGRRSRGGRS